MPNMKPTWKDKKTHTLKEQSYFQIFPVKTISYFQILPVKKIILITVTSYNFPLLKQKHVKCANRQYKSLISY